MFIRQLVTLVVAAAAAASAGAIPQLIGDGALIKRQTTTSTPSTTTSTSVPDAACTNGPLTRGCWGGGYSIATDYDAKWPNTGRVVKYNLVITNTTMAPDGYSRLVMVVNGQFPGPTIEANWGDTLSVTVTNNLQDNGTSIHWHGLRQANTNHMDGTNGVTECPLAPGDTKTYTFLCTQFGTSWYHSHYSAQYGDGILGAIKINGPATSNYDVDLGTMTVQDWYYTTAYQNAIRASQPTRPPIADNGLINGTMTSTYGGAYLRTTITKGKKYRLRLINTSLDNHFRVHLDGHNLTVITADFVPVVPYSTDWIFIGIGERYDVIINANQAVGNYWFRAQVQSNCGSNANNGSIKSIFSYSGAPVGDPTTNGTTTDPSSCADETRLVPYVKKDVPTDQFVPQARVLDVNLGRGISTNGQNIVQWNVNGSIINVDWEKPTLQYVKDGNTSYSSNMNLISLPLKNQWTFWIIQAVAGNVPTSVPHPIHLHGHDFYLMGQGQGVFSDPTALNYTNPPRKDVAMLPGGGWLVIGFFTDNPGAWLMHCHIAWHVGEGLAVQFLERVDDILPTLNIPPAWETTCQKWDAWYATAPYKKDDSGL